MNKLNRPQRTLEENYLKEHSLRIRFEEEIVKIIREILAASSLKLTVTSRTKEPNSFIAKANKEKGNGKKKYRYPLKEITDMTGIRVTTEYKDYAERLADILRRNFTIDYDNCRDTRQELSDSEFGYSAIHLVCTFPEELAKKYKFEAFGDRKFEIQIRTDLEHAWATKSRDFFYDKAINTQHKRELNRLAALLEIADKEFIELRDKVGKPIDSVAGIAATLHSLLSHEDTLQLMQNDPSIKEIISLLAQDGLKVNDTVRDEHIEAISAIFSRQKAQNKEDAQRILKDNAKNIAYAGKLFMKAAERQSHNRDTLFIPALAITGNGDISPEDYCATWDDFAKKAFITAAEQYRDHLANKSN